MVTTEWKNGKIIDALWKVDGDLAPKESADYKRRTNFKKGRGHVEDKTYIWRPLTSVCKEQLIFFLPTEEDQWFAPEATSHARDSSVGSAYTILTKKLKWSTFPSYWCQNCDA